mmetsp:Transcript_81444/g.143826  ORF Transcript_81444/g.143826 Transcript_81444/m.143826 type:complete len:146 (-) Transcript_81444:101-538(-)
MPPGLGHTLTAFTGDNEPSASSTGPLDGVSSMQMFRRLTPQLQQFLNSEPDLKKAWQEDVDEAVAHGRDASPEEARELRAAMDKNLFQMNREVEAMPTYLPGLSRIISGETKVAVGACPLLLAPAPFVSSLCSRQRKVGCFSSFL